MENPPDRCPAMLKRLWCQIAKRLWCQLAISYTVLTFCAMLLLITVLYTFDDYNDFHAVITPKNIEKLVISEKPIVMQAIREGGSPEWLNRARDNIREKLINVERGRGATIYRITNSSRPEVYMQITDRHGRLFLSDPVIFPLEMETTLAGTGSAISEKSNSSWVTKSNHIRIDANITNNSDDVIGYIRVLYIAEYSFLTQIRSTLGFLLHVFDYVFFISMPIGIACGLMASRYVTKQLQRMNEVTERWRQGDFGARIALPNDDVLIRHSQHLNEMAQDMEMYLSLKQHLAVSNERNRVARELHDTVKQKLFALGLQLATAKSKPKVMEAAREHILEAETITREAQRDLMEIITQLHPTETSEAAFRDRIGSIAGDFRRRFGVSIELSHFVSTCLDAGAQHQVLRIVQEALMNAVRHGKASRIAIAGMTDRDTAKLTIADNGNGFDTGRKTQGFGITSMRDRVRDLPCGTFDITSTEGVGTQVTLSWKNQA